MMIPSRDRDGKGKDGFIAVHRSSYDAIFIPDGQRAIEKDLISRNGPLPAYGCIDRKMALPGLWCAGSASDYQMLVQFLRCHRASYIR